MKKSAVLFLLTLSSLCIAQTWVKVSCGGEFTVALRSDGTLWAWGFNGNGQLGTGSTAQEFAPVQVGTDNDWSDVAAGGFHTLAIKKDGSLWACGFNIYGMVGDGTKEDRHTMVRIGSDNDWKSVEASFVNSFAIKTDGTLYGWGINNGYQLGDSLITESLDPLKIGVENTWVKVSAGAVHVLGLRSDHTLWGWGGNLNGELGMPAAGQAIAKAQKITNDNTWQDISAGFQFSTAVRSDHTLWSWGFNGNNQLGHSSSSASSDVPKQVPGTSWGTVCAGPSWTHATTLDGTLWGWGFNGAGQLGTSVSGQIIEPEAISQDFELVMMAAATGIATNNIVYGTHTFAIRGNAKSLCATGGNYAGQLGLGAPSNGIAEFDCTIGVLSAVEHEQSPLQVSMAVYPNPAEDHVTVSIPGAHSMRIAVTDLLGREVAVVTGNESETTIDLAGLSGFNDNGAYIISTTGSMVSGETYKASRLVRLQR